MSVDGLDSNEELILQRVLDLQLSLTRKSTPALLPLSLYSSELKGTRQVAGHLSDIRSSANLSDNSTSRARYFNSLFNQGLVEGNDSAPKLTSAANFYLQAFDANPDETFWRGDGGDEVELQVIRVLVERMQAGQAVSDPFKQAWFNSQTFFDYVPESEQDGVLADRDQLLFLYRINSNGWEIARYFRLNTNERKAFQAAFAKIKPSSKWSPVSQIAIAAAKYKDAADTIQSDVRYRISGFLKAFRQLRLEMGSALPRLDRQLSLRSGRSSGVGSLNTLKKDELEVSHSRLPQPYQLIVTGCPGSGKSYYVDQLVATSDCHLIRTQFHPETSFFDFVGAYKPQPVYEDISGPTSLVESDGTAFLRGRPLIDYRFVPGPLMQGLAHAIANPAQNVVVLIEEINRGNSAAIFGDILQLLDRDMTGRSRYSIVATPEIRAFLAGLGHTDREISLPPNLYLWATMNSGDQGVFPLDTAFRRRWSFVYKGFTEPCLYAEENSKILYGGKKYSWDAFRGTINLKLVDLGIHEDKLIGPYFLTEAQLNNPADILEKLFLYLWDDVLRFRTESLFSCRSFSQVVSAWGGGAGSPLSIALLYEAGINSMPDPVVETSSDSDGSAALANNDLSGT